MRTRKNTTGKHSSPTHNYERQFLSLLQSGDYDGALGWVGEVIKKAKPRPPWPASDGIHPPAPATRLAGIENGFQPIHTLVQRAAGLCHLIEQAQVEEKHKAGQFNALVFRIHHFDHSEVFVDPAHYNPATGKVKEIYWGPGEQNITFQDDWKDDFEFVSDLTGRENYLLTFQGKAVSGDMAHYHLRVGLLLRWLRELVETLIPAPRFIKIPKATPFKFFASSVPRDDVPSAFFVEIVPKTGDSQQQR